MNEASEHAELNKRAWDKRADKFDRFGYFRFFQKRVVSLARPQENGHFLDIGCGIGWAVRYAAGIVGARGEACGIDISPKMIERATVNSSSLKNVHFYVANAEALPFAENYFDYITCTQSFHHYLNPLKVLGEMFRVLKPGKKIYILDPTADVFIVRLFERRFSMKDSGHVKLYSTTEFKEMFESAGLKWSGAKTIIPIMKVHIGER